MRAWALWVIPAVVFAPFLANPFVWEDRAYLVQHADQRDLRLVGKFFVPREYAALGWPRPHPVYRPLAGVTHLLDQQIWGLRPAPRRLENLLLHLGCVWLLFRLAGMFVSRAAAGWAALLFALHPMCGDVVFGVIYRTAPLATGLMLAAAILWLDGPPARGWWAVPLYGVAGLVKESAFTLPAILLAGDLARGDARDGGGWSRARAHGPAFLALLVVAAGHLALRARLLEGHTHVVAPTTVAAGLSSLAAGAKTVREAAQMVIWPFHLSRFHPLSPDPFPPALSWRDAGVLSGAAVVVVLLAVVAAAWRRSPACPPWRAVAFGLAAAGLALLPNANVIRLPGYPLHIADKHLYLPLVGVAVAVGGALERLQTAWAGRAWPTCPPWRVARAGLVGLLAAFAAATAAHGIVWRDGPMLAGMLAEAYPRHPAFHTPYADELREAGRLTEAAEVYERVAAADPAYAPTWLNLGWCLQRLGRYGESAVAYRGAIRAAPQEGRGYYGLGRIAFFQRRYGESAGWLREAVARSPENGQWRRALGVAYVKAGRLREAESVYRETARRRP